MKIWLAASAALFALTGVAMAFFMLGSFGFVHITALYWLCYLSGLHLLVALAVWLCREKLRRRWKKALLVFACVLSSLVITLVVGVMTLQVGFYGDSTSALHRSTVTSRSPDGTNRVIAYASFHNSSIMAAPMVNRWVYRGMPPTRVRAYIYGLEIEWASEYRAMVRVLDYPDDDEHRYAHDGIGNVIYVAVEFSQ